MKRLIICSGNKLTICTQAISSGDIVERYIPIFSLTKESGKEFTLELSGIVKGFYIIPSELSSSQEKAAHLITLLTRAEESQTTDMHKILNSFVSGKVTSGSMFNFENDGSFKREPEEAYNLINKI
ncbi:TPA: type IV secretion protein Dot [Legionella pneumophila]|nr:type IV secretion protein Dot [Legionella pneumophila]MDW8877720.1 type IV secretion protein Dot [Legionella pneumophila subsp. fraseri]MDW8960759.1 type IV secretion protein Dot [Legionella pneumophila subsp. fraseri]MDW9035218.1 type IV secretion protein Dot [Legionella pneumophila subsp. fraseri]MDW9038279.1 type IV secretion protein Dot [Legionella pneumophila subsp. fraseri]MDW9041340.1 type IV secretion protein Dot [Legionella pneumophila subsp. fraseri]